MPDVRITKKPVALKDDRLFVTGQVEIGQDEDGTPVYKEVTAQGWASWLEVGGKGWPDEETPMTADEARAYFVDLLIARAQGYAPAERQELHVDVSLDEPVG